MCGIVAILERAGAVPSEPALRRMTTAIAHRGPDGEGIHVDGPVGLGNRRLAIIDLSSAGAQPMTNETGDVVVTYNGEIYNFRELRRELERAGHRFRSRTDTEVIVHAYEEWGADCVTRFNGMFAFALWDAQRLELFLARDRYGIKPLYYCEAGDTFLVASEIKALLEHPSFRVDVSLPHLLQYFTFQNVFDDGTMFKDVKMLRPSHHLTVAADGRPLRPKQYWEFHFAEPEQQGDDDEYREELARLLRLAVDRQLVSDAPVGAYLSGGMDSGSITALAAASLPYLTTFTVGFDLTSASGLELGMDERARAERLSYLFKTEHYESVLKAGDMTRCLPNLVWHLEDLRVGQSYPNYYVSRLASKFVKVVLGGTGGDELFAGYPWRYYRALVNDDFDHYVEKYYGFWHRLLPNRELHGLFRPHVWGEIEHLRTIEVFRDVLPDREKAPESPEEYLCYSQHLEAKTFLHGLLMVDDKLAMAHGLELRVPFLDNDLVDFAQRLPARLKLRHLADVVELNENEPGDKTERYYRATGDGKVLLRDVLRRWVPDIPLDEVKQGFSGPDASWFRGESIDYVREQIMSNDARIYEFLEPRTVQRLVEEHLDGKVNRRLLLWSLLNFEHWCRTFVDGEVEAVPVLTAGEVES
jgi:asparagine synthase (glutamine-hydrolysing)